MIDILKRIGLILIGIVILISLLPIMLIVGIIYVYVRIRLKINKYREDVLYYDERGD